jgi:hypothetical protein
VAMLLLASRFFTEAHCQMPPMIVVRNDDRLIGEGGLQTQIKSFIVRGRK